MKHAPSVWKLLPVASMVIVLSGCSSNPAAPRAGPERAKAEEAVIRRTLADLEERINKGDPGFVDIFAKDAVIIAPAAPDVVGFDAIRTMYTSMMKQVSMAVHFSTNEVAIAGDLAYERGTYTLKITDKASGRVLQDVRNKHLHILKRQPDGTWKTWRMMVSSAEPAIRALSSVIGSSSAGDRADGPTQSANATWYVRSNQIDKRCATRQD